MLPLRGATAPPQLQLELLLPDASHAGFICSASIVVGNLGEGERFLSWVEIFAPWGAIRATIREGGAPKRIAAGSTETINLTFRVPSDVKTPQYAPFGLTVALSDTVKGAPSSIVGQGAAMWIFRAEVSASLSVKSNKVELWTEEDFQLEISYQVSGLPEGNVPLLIVGIDGMEVVEMNLTGDNGAFALNLTAPSTEGDFSLNSTLYYYVGSVCKVLNVSVGRVANFDVEWATLLLEEANSTLLLARGLYYDALSDGIQVDPEVNSSLHLAKVELDKAREAFDDLNESVLSLSEDSLNASRWAQSMILQSLISDLHERIDRLQVSVNQLENVIDADSLREARQVINQSAVALDRINSEPESASELYSTAVSRLNLTSALLNQTLEQHRSRVRLMVIASSSIMILSLFLILVLSLRVWRERWGGRPRDPGEMCGTTGIKSNGSAVGSGDVAFDRPHSWA